MLLGWTVNDVVCGAKSLLLLHRNWFLHHDAEPSEQLHWCLSRDFKSMFFWTKLIPLESATQTMMYRGLIVEILYVSALLNKYGFSLLYSWCLLTVQQVTCFHITITTSIIVRTKNDHNFITALWLASSAKRKLQFSEITWSVFLVIVDDTTASLY